MYKNLKEKIFKNISGGKYVGSGLIITTSQIVAGFVVLRWLEPENLGKWQSFTVFTSYLNILTLGVTSGINRELPYLLGKGKEDHAIEGLKTAGYFTTTLSLTLMGLVLLTGIGLYQFEILSFDLTLMMIFAFSIGALQIQTSFLGATYRSSSAFNKLANIQFLNSLFYIILIPLVIYFEIWGFVAYQILIALLLYSGYQYFRPYKVKYKFNMLHLKELIRVGSQIFFWNYLSGLSRSIPRFILIIFGSPLLVGLFAPAASINNAMFKLPTYINRYLFPQMSFKFGKTDSQNEVYKYVRKAGLYLTLLMMSAGIFLALAIPYLFPIFFPKYVEGIIAAQIMVFSGVLFSLNLLIHNALNSIKEFKAFKFIISFRLLYITTFTGITYYVTQDLLLSVSIGAVLAELFNLGNYIFFLKKSAE